jgi:hypothetical protein
LIEPRSTSFGPKGLPIMGQDAIIGTRALAGALTLLALAGCVTPTTTSKTVAFWFRTAHDVALVAVPPSSEGLPADGSPQSVSLSTSRLPVRGLITDWEANYELIARREGDGAVRLVWATNAPTEGGYGLTVLPADATLTLKGLPAEFQVPGDLLERGGEVSLEWCNSFRDVAPSGRHGRGSSSFRQESRLILPLRLSPEPCTARGDARYALRTSQSNVMRVTETLRHSHDVPTWKVELFLLGLLGAGAALVEVAVTPRADSTAKLWGGLSAALGVAIAALVLPDLLVRVPPDREVNYDSDALTAPK